MHRIAFESRQRLDRRLFDVHVPRVGWLLQWLYDALGEHLWDREDSSRIYYGDFNFSSLDAAKFVCVGALCSMYSTASGDVHALALLYVSCVSRSLGIITFSSTSGTLVLLLFSFSFTSLVFSLQLLNKTAVLEQHF